ncbi:hypothetical protein ACFX2F_030812 [Malus domestica]
MMLSASSLGFHPDSSSRALSTLTPSFLLVCCNYYLAEVESSFCTSAATTGVKDFFFDSLRTGIVHRLDMAWSTLISPTALPGMRNQIF